MSASKEAIKQLKVKTGTVTRCACAPIVLQRTAKGSAGGTAARALSLVQPKLVAAGKSRPDRTQRLPFFSVAYRALPSRADGARCPRWIGRCLKDLAYTDKEIKSQLERIEKVRQDPEKDEHDVRKQEEVLAEYTTAKPFEQGQLHGYFTALEEKVTILRKRLEPAVKPVDRSCWLDYDFGYALRWQNASEVYCEPSAAQNASLDGARAHAALAGPPGGCARCRPGWPRARHGGSHGGLL
jgi:hypothetical protein